MRFTAILTLAGLSLAASGAPVTADEVGLKATGSKNAYALINSVLAPDGNVVETPDCGHDAFGPHITQIFDRTLNQHVFRFHIHRDHDDDRCRKADRQRTEIKVYKKSPEPLKAVQNDVHTLRWKFKLDRTFQPSRRFTHLHQIKAVGGSEAGMPLVTLSARKGRDGKPDRFELRYAEHSKQRTLHWVDLQPFLGRWLEVTERISFGENGKYSVQVTSVPTGETLFTYSTGSLRMWKSGAEFLRPKWGIYRSLKDTDNLKDEIVDFANFRISF